MVASANSPARRLCSLFPVQSEGVWPSVQQGLPLQLSSKTVAP